VWAIGSLCGCSGISNNIYPPFVTLLEHIESTEDVATMVPPTDTRLLLQSFFVVTKMLYPETCINRGSREEHDGRVMHSADGCQ
jgi:hypothetical protein